MDEKFGTPPEKGSPENEEFHLRLAELRELRLLKQHRSEMREKWITRIIVTIVLVAIIGGIAWGITAIVQNDAQKKRDFVRKCNTLHGYVVKADDHTDCRQKDTGYIMLQR